MNTYVNSHGNLHVLHIPFFYYEGGSHRTLKTIYLGATGIYIIVTVEYASNVILLYLFHMSSLGKYITWRGYVFFSHRIRNSFGSKERLIGKNLAFNLYCRTYYAAGTKRLWKEELNKVSRDIHIRRTILWKTTDGKNVIAGQSFGQSAVSYVFPLGKDLGILCRQPWICFFAVPLWPWLGRC